MWVENYFFLEKENTGCFCNEKIPESVSTLCFEQHLCRRWEGCGGFTADRVRCTCSIVIIVFLYWQLIVFPDVSLKHYRAL